MQRYVQIGGALFSVALLSGIVACSGRSESGTALPPEAQASLNQLLPAPSVTPPVTAPVAIVYPYTNTWTTKTWAGPTATPSTAPGSDDGVTTVKFTLDKKSGIYNVLERIKSKTGYIEDLHSAIGFLPHGGGIAQIILSDDYTFVQGSFSETGTDTYPNGENSFDFPLTTGNRWSAAAAHTSDVDQVLSGRGGFEENDAYTEAADGQYFGQISFASRGHSKIQNNYASTTHVSLLNPSRYTLSEPAEGYNKLTQLFELPSGGYIAVRSKGHEPLPFKRGTVKVPDWYPGNGELSKELYSDRFTVVGPMAMPTECGKRKGEHSVAVVEKFADLDPVQGFYNTYKASYFLKSLAKGQFWFACIIEAYKNDTYADGWAMSAGNWGKLSSEQIGTEILIASATRRPDSGMMPEAIAPQPLTFPIPVVVGRSFVR
jgi:hypothetical protein